MRVFPALALLLLVAHGPAWAQDEEPAVVITSPDTATTFPRADVQHHVLLWDSRTGQLFAHVVFVQIDQDDTGASNEDTHDFRLPGVTFDEKKGVFLAPSSQGDLIPVARIKKTLFLKTIEPLPNARVRIEHPHGNVSVVLEAIRPG
jgi:hypothetical protein